MVEVNVSGIGNVPVNPQDGIDPQTLSRYQDLLGQIEDIFKRRPLTESDADELRILLDQVEKFAKEGGLSREMIERLGQIFAMLEAVGINPGGMQDNKTLLEAMQVLQDFKTSGVDANGDPIELTFLSLFDLSLLSNEAKTLEDMIKTDLIQWATNYFETKLRDLADALDLSLDILDNLKELQKILNQVTVPNPAQYNFPPKSAADIPPELVDKIREMMGKKDDQKGEGDAFWNEWNNPNTRQDAVNRLNKWLEKGDNALKYIQTSNDYFKQIISPTPYLKDGTVEELLNLRDALKAQITALKGAVTNPKETNALIDSLQKVVDGLDSTFAEYDKMKKANPNNPNLKAKGIEAATKWILDSRDQVGGASGDNQDNVANAIEAGGNLNDSVKDELSQVKSTYDNFMTVAAAIIDALNKIITKFAQGAKS